MGSNYICPECWARRLVSGAAWADPQYCDYCPSVRMRWVADGVRSEDFEANPLPPWDSN